MFLLFKYLTAFIFLVACANHHNKPAPGNNGAIKFKMIEGRVDDTLAGRHVILIQNFKDSLQKQGTMLVLPGWNFAADRWLKETDLEKIATDNGFRLILPDMERSIYATHYYDETTADMRKQKTGKWLIDTLLPLLQQQYNILKPDQYNVVLGLSTGGRGVIYCLLHGAVIFKAGATFSGDFDQAQMPDDKIMTAVYGNSKKFNLRWHWDDNMMAWSNSIYQPVYIAHGMNDKVVPPQQSIALANRLEQLHKNQKIVFHFPEEAGHDFKFWGNELKPAILFLKEQENKISDDASK